MVTVEITAGICGFVTLAKVEPKDSDASTVTLRLESDCPNWQKVDTLLAAAEIEVMSELFPDRESKTLYAKLGDISREKIPHVSCPVTSGVLKAMEVCAGLALAKDASIVFK